MDKSEQQAPAQPTAVVADNVEAKSEQGSPPPELAEVRAAEAAVDGGAATPESSSVVRQGRRRGRAVAAAAAGPKRCNVGLQQVLVFSRMPLGCDPWAQVYDVTP